MIILASKSPRRQELLRLLVPEFTVMTEDVDEWMDASLPLEEAVARVSRRKAAAVLPSTAPEDVVICADTIVVLEGRIMGKPVDPDEAFSMLRSLSGRSHTVMTAVTVCARGEINVAVERTEVVFRRLSDREIRAYIATGEPMDKAGAYGIQGRASSFVSHLDGDYFNVMGLPLCRLTLMLRACGVPILEEDENP